MLSFYDKEELKRHDEVMAEWLECGKVGKKPRAPRPLETYVFYPKTGNNNSIGSIAIYGKDAIVRSCAIRRSSTLFGLPVKEVKMEMGIRPYVDVVMILGEELLRDLFLCSAKI